METYAADIRIGGQISRKNLRDLLNAIELECVYEGGGDAQSHVLANRITFPPGQPLYFYSPETPWGRFDQIEASCISLGLSFERWSSDGERTVFDGAETRNYRSDTAGAAVLGIDDIQRLGLTDFSKIEAYFQVANASPPPFEIVEPDNAPLREYAFDLKLLSTVRLKAGSEDDARQRLAEHLDAASANFGAWTHGPELGLPIIAEASMDGSADLIEIDGEPVA
jgi:hypothetical protein